MLQSTSWPSFANASFISGVLSARTSASFSFATCSRGVPAVTSMPFQVVAVYPAMPASIMVGTSGSDSVRVRPVTASALSLPPRICGSAEGSTLNMNCAWPPITSVCACAPPLYGMCTTSMPVVILKSSAARCSEVPVPGDA